MFFVECASHPLYVLPLTLFTLIQSANGHCHAFSNRIGEQLVLMADNWCEIAREAGRALQNGCTNAIAVMLLFFVGFFILLGDYRAVHRFVMAKI